MRTKLEEISRTLFVTVQPVQPVQPVPPVPSNKTFSRFQKGGLRPVKLKPPVPLPTPIKP